MRDGVLHAAEPVRRSLSDHPRADRGRPHAPAAGMTRSRSTARCACCMASAIPTCRGRSPCASPSRSPAGCAGDAGEGRRPPPVAPAGPGAAAADARRAAGLEPFHPDWQSPRISHRCLGKKDQGLRPLKPPPKAVPLESNLFVEGGGPSLCVQQPSDGPPPSTNKTGSKGCALRGVPRLRLVPRGRATWPSLPGIARDCASFASQDETAPAQKSRSA